MHIPSLLTERFADALSRCDFASELVDVDQYASMVRPAGNARFGDYQANCAMPIGKLLADSNPREVAAQLVEKVQLDDLCDPPEIAGPGFINLKMTDVFLQTQLTEMLGDDRCLVSRSESPKTIVLDYSSPNVAKPMHVGHIRTTVIGTCLAETLQFLGHKVISDNHLGDWGTQFGMIIYGYKHFGDPDVVAKNPVPELAQLYRIVHQLMEYQKAVDHVPRLEAEIQRLQEMHSVAVTEAEAAEGKDAKKKRKSADSLVKKIAATENALQSARSSIATTQADPVMNQRAADHANIGTAVLDETSKLHSGDKQNLDLWEQFLPHCKDEINRIYSRLNVRFDHTLGQ